MPACRDDCGAGRDAAGELAFVRRFGGCYNSRRGREDMEAEADMRRIFYLITELDVGGAEKSLYELATHLDRTRFEAVVGCLTGHGPVGKWLEEAGIEVVYLDMASWWDIGAWLRLRRELRDRRPHVLHTFLFHANLAGRIAAVKLGIGTKIAAIRVEEPRRRHLCAEWLTHRLVDVVTCVSESARRHTHRRAHVPMDKLVAIPNGIDPLTMDMPVMAAPREWQLPEGVPVVASIGRLDRQKDPLLLLRAAARVIGELPETIFVFAGRGPLESRCRTNADRLGIAGNIRWLGWLADVRPLLARMDVLALSSRWEGMPNVVLEAMACRKPVVVTDTGGCAELVVEAETGFLVPPGDEKMLSARIINLLRDLELRKKLGAAARERVARDFSVHAMVERNERLYE